MKTGFWRSGIQRCSALASAGLLAVAGCATPGGPSRPDSPVLTPVADAPTGTHRPGSFVWHDLLTPDADAARAFYGALFGWTFAQRGRYVEIRNRGRKIGGIVQVESGDGARPPAIWLPSLSVPDVDEAAALVKAEGGKVVRGPVDMPGRGRGALFADPRGAHLVLLRAAGGDPPDRDAAIGDWLWDETWTRDLEGTVAFYLGLGVYDSCLQEDDYAVLLRDGKWRAGIRGVAAADHPVRWIPVVRVEDPGALLDAVEGLGGTVWVRPGQYDNPDTALVSDSRGAFLMLQRWTGSAGEAVR